MIAPAAGLGWPPDGFQDELKKPPVDPSVIDLSKDDYYDVTGQRRIEHE